MLERTQGEGGGRVDPADGDAQRGVEEALARRRRRVGADARATDAAESAVIAQVERSLVAVSQRTSTVVRPPPSARSASQATRPGGLSPRVAYAPTR